MTLSIALGYASKRGLLQPHQFGWSEQIRKLPDALTGGIPED
jgi:hypothetical protein